MPEGSVLTYVNDEALGGVARAKNASLKVLESLGVTHYFLVDNDTVPLSEDWYKPFVNSKENHLLYNFPLEQKGVNDMRVVHEDKDLIAYTHTRGCFIYVTQKVLDTVGGFDTRYFNSLEHADYTTRIHNAGLTTHRSMTPKGTDKLIYCLDQDGLIKTSIEYSIPNLNLYKRNKKSREYMEFRI